MKRAELPTFKVLRLAFNFSTLKLCTSALLFCGCEQGMRDQPRHEAQEKSEFFRDGTASRPQVEGTVARGELRVDRARFAGREDGGFVSTFPFALRREDLERGRERYLVYCAVCHDAAGNGGGMVVRRGYRAPPSLHEERLRTAPVGQLFDAANNGIGQMPAYRALVRTDDLWRIVAYIRVLQLSRHVDVARLRAEERRALEADRP